MKSSTPPGRDGPDFRGRVLGGRFHLDTLVGRGGTASVYAASDRHMRRTVALKVLHPEHTRSEEQRRRIRQEARVGGWIEHRNVVRVLDFGEELTESGETIIFVVMPLVSGVTLRGLILEGALPWRRSVDLVRQLLAGVGAIHRAGALHRDLKPNNCFVSRDDGVEHLRVLDFGLAKVVRPGLISRSPGSRTGVFCGTLAYAAPEQVLGLPLDVRADLYAVGVILFELLTRRLPFTGSDYAVLRAIVETPAPSPRELAPAANIPAQIEAVVLRALAKEPDDRYSSADDFDRALVEAVALAGDVDAATLRPCPAAHLGADEAEASLAAWTCFDYEIARDQAARAAEINRAWSPLALLMSLVPDDV